MRKFLIANIYPNDFLITKDEQFIEDLKFGKHEVGNDNQYIHKEFTPHEFINDEESEIYYIDLTNEESLLKLFDFSKSVNSYTQVRELQIDNINYVRLHTEKYIFFQKITKRNIIRKSFISEVISLKSETKTGKVDRDADFTLSSKGQKILSFADVYDFVFELKTKRVYFKKLEKVTNIFIGFSKFFRDAVDEDVAVLKKYRLIDFDYKFDQGTKDFDILCGTRNVGSIGKLNLKNIVIFSDNIEKFNKINIKKFQKILEEFELDLKILDAKVQIMSNKDLTSFFKVLFSRFHINLLTDEKMENKGARLIGK
ncbi:hypothetical protein [Aquella oligotrophica]|uniref:Uncharacterized protein n=1 Tax=Aquella oligotrophica TaxID=2067065 RepID=A0A2I7N7B3_9NEIS|nr:hypothetical protein [Aquella oligotrophica]AUR52356.1 hypothetical protein CUN60_08625 [Aquella oligotrophica]